MHAWIDARNGKANLYFLVNPTFKPKDSKAGRTDIYALVALHVDADVREGEDQVEGIKRIVGTFSAYKVPPTVITSSGGGAQAFWLLKEPLLLDGSKEAAEDAKLYNVQLERDLDGDHCHDISRIMRLPGTVNLPDKVKRDKGRKAAVAHVVEGDSTRRYPLEEFTKASADKPPTKDEQPEAASVVDWAKAAAHAREYEKTLPDDLPQKAKVILGHNGSLGDLRNALREADLMGDAKLTSSSHVTQMLVWSLKSSGKFSNEQIAGLATCERRCNNGGDWKSIKNKAISPTVQRHIMRSLESVPANAKPKFDSEWTGGCDKYGIPLNNYLNTKSAITNLGITCRWDEFRMREMLDGSSEKCVNGRVSDKAISRIRDRIVARFDFYPDKERICEAVTNLCIENACNPPLEWLDSLVWDGVPRLSKYLHVYLGAPDTKLNEAFSVKIWCAIVRRIKHPGTQWDHQLVLAGKQGIRKSTHCMDLAIFPDLFTDAGDASMTIKETIEAIQGKQIIEFPEMVGHSVKTREKTKARITRRIDEARLAYDKYRTEAPRSSVIIGTINEGGYLNDPTGERRYWHVDVTTYDRDAFLRDKAQLYAEAIAKEPTEALWLDTPELQAEHEAITASVKEPNELVAMLEGLQGEVMPVQTFVDGKQVIATEERVSNATIRHRLGITGADTVRLHGLGRKIAEAMMQLGWSKPDDPLRCTKGGSKERGFRRPCIAPVQSEVPF